MMGALTGLMPGVVTSGIADLLSQSVMGVLSGAAVVVLYFSARCRHEMFDLQRLAELVHSEAVKSEAADME